MRNNSNYKLNEYVVAYVHMAYHMQMNFIAGIKIPLWQIKYFFDISYSMHMEIFIRMSIIWSTSNLRLVYCKNNDIKKDDPDNHCNSCFQQLLVKILIFILTTSYLTMYANIHSSVVRCWQCLILHVNTDVYSFGINWLLLPMFQVPHCNNFNIF